MKYEPSTKSTKPRITENRFMTSPLKGPHNLVPRAILKKIALTPHDFAGNFT